MKIFKWLLGILVSLALIGIVIVFLMSENKPEGNAGDEADQMANNMLKALNYESFDTTRYFRWDFGGRQAYFYDKTNNQAIITWGENKVFLQMDSKIGKTFVNGKEQTGDEHTQLIDKAWSHWCNDSFWMFAPFKVFDPGTSRKIVKEEGKDALLIEYASGGVTPGDSYLWILGEDHIPTGYKMWTSIIPLKGMYASWENWKTFEGAKYSTLHNLGFTLEMKDFLASNELSDFGYTSNPFE